MRVPTTCCYHFVVVLLLNVFTSRFTFAWWMPFQSIRVSRTALDATQQRRPWEFGRFLQQSSRFVNLPLNRPKSRSFQPGDVVFPSTEFGWAPLDDVVMGGASSSSVVTSGTNTVVWTGTVTDANNGGFVGMRTTPTLQYDLSSCQGLAWKVRLLQSPTKQGKCRFKVGVRDTSEFNGIIWNASFDALPNRVTTIAMPWKKLIPTLFAQTRREREFRPESVSSLQLVLSKFEYDGDLNPNFAVGDMKLELLEVKAY